MNDFIQNKVIPFAQKIENNFILSAISGAFMKVMPALLGGAVFSLFQGLPLGDSVYKFFIVYVLSTYHCQLSLTLALDDKKFVYQSPNGKP